MRWYNLTESKKIIVSEHKEFFYVFNKEEFKVKPITVDIYIPFVKNENKIPEISPNNKEIDNIKKRRALKRWRQSLGYYSLHPDKFKFSFKDIK